MRITESSHIVYYAYLYTVILFILCHEIHAQAPEVEWVKGYGNPNGGHVHHGMQTNDGGYIAVGTSRIGEERYVGLIIKTDSMGNKEWLTNVGSDDKSDYGFINQILETKEGNYIAGGALCTNGEQDRALFFLDSKGNITAQKTFPGKGFDAIEGIDFTTDGGIIATGYIDGDEPGGFIIYGGKCFIMKTDSIANLEWDKMLDPVFHGMRVLQTQDGGYAVCSNIPRNNTEDLDFCLLKTDRNGDLLWYKSYGGEALENCFDFDLTPDNGFVLGGHTRTYTAVEGGWNAWLVKTDSNGNLQWHKSFGEPLQGDPLWIYDEAYGVKSTPDGGYILACGTGIEPENVREDYNPNNFWSSYVIKTDATGELQWEHIYKKEGLHNAAEYVNICRDGGYIIFLDADGFTENGANAFGFLKLSPER
jgi:hypothetical protein